MIIILLGRPSAPRHIIISYTFFETIYEKNNIFIQLFDINKLSFNVTKHELVYLPKHTIISDEQKNNIMKKYQLSDELKFLEMLSKRMIPLLSISVWNQDRCAKSPDRVKPMVFTLIIDCVCSRYCACNNTTVRKFSCIPFNKLSFNDFCCTLYIEVKISEIFDLKQLISGALIGMKPTRCEILSVF